MKQEESEAKLQRERLHKMFRAIPGAGYALPIIVPTQPVQLFGDYINAGEFVMKNNQSHIGFVANSPVDAVALDEFVRRKMRKTHETIFGRITFIGENDGKIHSCPYVLVRRKS